MTLNFSPTSNITKLIIIVELILVIYLLNTLTVSVYRGYQIDQVIKQFELDNNRLADDNKKKAEDYDYFTSPNYIEKIAKQNLGLVNAGEEVIVLPSTSTDQTKTSKAQDDQENPNLLDLSNDQKWWLFFFDRK